MDDKIPWPFPGRVGRVFWCLVHGWCSFLWLSLDAGGPLPTLSWYGARCRERPPGWAGPSVLCSHTRPPLLASLSSAPVQGSNIKFPLCFWHLRIFFSVVWLWGYFSFIVSLFVCLFFWAWSYDFKIYSFYFCVWSRKGDFSMSAPSLLLTKTICHFIYGFLSLFKIFTRACVVNVYISGCICHDADLLWFIKPFS